MFNDHWLTMSNKLKGKKIFRKKMYSNWISKGKKCCCSHSFYMGFVNRLFLSSSSRSCEVLSVACFKYMYVPQIYFLRIWQTTLQIWNAHTFFTHQILCRSICASVTFLFSEVPCFFFLYFLTRFFFIWVITRSFTSFLKRMQLRCACNNSFLKHFVFFTCSS